VQNDESLWLARAQEGDPEAFRNLVETYQQPVYNLCYRMLHNAGDAEDAAQETFLRAYKHLSRYDRNRPFATWLLSIAAHYCIDQTRKQRMTLISMDENPYLNLSDGAPGPESSVSRAEQDSRVRALLEGLSPVDRAAIVMYYWYDFSYLEIAEALSLTNSAVKSRLHRARRSMAEAWIERKDHAEQFEEEQRDEVESPAI
jgi:RNA polymerase sigma-70 factor (ECF subfamily)